LTIDIDRLDKPLEAAYFEVAERQALPLIFICHFVLRMHQQLMLTIRERRPELEWIDWQLMPNKFPGDVNGPMGVLFHAIMSGAAYRQLVAGNVRIVTIDKSNDDLGSSLADNIAGLLADKLEFAGKAAWQSALEHIGGSIGWEIWE
jgi:hypothetical protein